MSYLPGDTLLIKDPNPWDDRRHLYIVVTDPKDDPQGCMLLPCVVSKMSYTRDLSCELHPGDHPFIRHDSVINYRESTCLSSEGLDALIRDGHATMKEPLTQEVLDRVIEGARQSPNLDMEKRKMLPKRKDR